MPTAFRDTLEQINLVLTIGFAVEMVLKLLALGVVAYWQNSFNCLDGFIVIISVVELLLYRGSSNTGFTALRALRLTRIMRSMKLL